MRVILDTNARVAAFAAHGLCETLLDECFHRRGILTRALLCRELMDVLTRKLAPDLATLKQIKALWMMASCVADAPAVHVDDARLLRAAAAVGAEALVAGDKAALDRHGYEGMPIRSPRQMFEHLTEEG